MRWIFVRNAVNFAVNFCKECGEMWWIIFFHHIHRFHRISYIILPQKLMRWIFVRNAVKFAVNFCKKCGEMRWNIYFHRIHRNQRISYKNSPHSPHFLQKVTLKPRPGWVEFWRWIFVRNAVKCGEKKNFHRVFFTSFWMRWMRFSLIIVKHYCFWLSYDNTNREPRKIIPLCLKFIFSNFKYYKN